MTRSATGKANRKGRNEQVEYYTTLTRAMLDDPAWRALSIAAKAAYPVLKLEWRGPKANNNGSISLSIRQLAEALGVTPDTAHRALWDLAAKGFVAVSRPGVLGTSGSARSTEYELTELPLPGQTQGRRLYRDWRPGTDFPVIKAPPGYRRGRG